jgi:hypothetical protein
MLGLDLFPSFGKRNGPLSISEGQHRSSGNPGPEKGVAQGVVPPVAVVAPFGYVNSMWVDSKNGRKPAETSVILEFVPHIENNMMTQHRNRLPI